MLVLKRRIGELIRIGDEIVIHVVEVCDRSTVRIGIDAPRSVPVHREEVWQKVQFDDDAKLFACRFCGRQKYRIQLVGGLCQKCHEGMPE